VTAAYFSRFYSKSCCFQDLRPYLGLLLDLQRQQQTDVSADVADDVAAGMITWLRKQADSAVFSTDVIRPPTEAIDEVSSSAVHTISCVNAYAMLLRSDSSVSCKAYLELACLERLVVNSCTLSCYRLYQASTRLTAFEHAHLSSGITGRKSTRHTAAAEADLRTPVLTLHARSTVQQQQQQ
jgi:N-acetyltransferase B complex (NatB) non catalytic subunit